MIHPPRLPKPLPTAEPEALADHVHVFQASLIGLDYSDLQAGGVILEQVRVRKVQFLRSKMPPSSTPQGLARCPSNSIQK